MPDEARQERAHASPRRPQGQAALPSEALAAAGAGVDGVLDPFVEPLLPEDDVEDTVEVAVESERLSVR